LPAVARVLRESFGRKVRRSAYMRSASAVGLAIRAAAASDRCTTNSIRISAFGGRQIRAGGSSSTSSFRAVCSCLLQTNRLFTTSVYKPAHNIGHFRYLECSRLDQEGQPVGEITNWEQIQFPFDPQLWGHSDLAAEPVKPLANANDLMVREEYFCDSDAICARRFPKYLRAIRANIRLRSWPPRERGR